MQCPLVLLVKVGLVRIRRLVVEKVKWRREQEEKLSWVLLHSHTISNFVINLGGGGGAALGESFMSIWKTALG
jgi:hypothetical protein